jgi:DNA-binding NarL/FixJ family response regulator
MNMPASQAEAPAPAQVLIVDDHPILRHGIAQLIDREPDLHTCAEAASVDEAQQVLATKRVDLAVIDISLGGVSGIELIKSIHTRRPGIGCLVLSMHDESLYAERALRAGARGYVMKQEATRKIITALRQVRAGYIYVSEQIGSTLLRRLTGGLAAAPADSPLALLSPRELEVFRLIGQGFKSGEIARQLCRSVNTVEAHRASIKRKLNARNGADLARLAFQALQDGQVGA